MIVHIRSQSNEKRFKRTLGSYKFLGWWGLAGLAGAHIELLSLKSVGSRKVVIINYERMLIKMRF